MSRRPYLTPHRLNELRASLTTSEWAVLEDVATMRLAVATDLQRLQVLRSPMSVRHFRRLLAGLEERGVLFRLDRSIGGRARGSAGYVYGVAKAGHRLRTLDAGAAARRPWTPRPSWTAHAVATGRLYVLLRSLESQHRLRLLRFQAEPAAWRTFHDGMPTTLKPDAHVVVEHGEYRDSYFVEVDCATESPTTLARKCDVYRRYWLSGAEQREHAVFPKVLWLVPTNQRRRIVSNVIAGLQDARELHVVERYDAIAAIFDEQPP